MLTYIYMAKSSKFFAYSLTYMAELVISSYEAVQLLLIRPSVTTATQINGNRIWIYMVPVGYKKTNE